MGSAVSTTERQCGPWPVNAPLSIASIMGPPPPPSSDCTLRRLLVLAGEQQRPLSPSFSPSVSSFTCSIHNEKEEVFILALPNHYRAVVDVMWGTDVNSGGPHTPIPRHTDTFLVDFISSAEGTSTTTSPTHEKHPPHWGGFIPSTLEEESVVADKPAFRVTNLQVGENALKVIITSENGSEHTYYVSVTRQAWDPHGWKPGTLDDKLRWYRRGAEFWKYPEAQHRLALLYVGEELNDDGTTSKVNVSEMKLAMTPEELNQHYYKLLLSSAHEGYADSQFRLGTGYFDCDIPSRVFYNDLKYKPSPKTARSSPVTTSEGNGDEIGVGGGGGGLNDESELVAEVEEKYVDVAAPEVGGGGGDEEEEKEPDFGSLVFETKDYWERASHWFHKAGEQGHRGAAAKLVLMYIHGQGVDIDFRQAIHWHGRSNTQNEEFLSNMADMMKRNAEKGSERAAYQLAEMYSLGIGVDMDYESAIEYFDRAGRDRDESLDYIVESFNGSFESRGDRRAAYQLALMHSNGIGVEMSYVKALFWLNRAGQSKDEAYDTVYGWLKRKGEEEGDPKACEQLGLCYADGIGTHIDYKKAVQSLERSGQSHEEAAVFIANRLREAAEKKSKDACYQMALMYVDGVGVEANYETALQWLRKSGSSQERAQKQALELFQSNTENGDVRSAYQLALMYVDGAGVDIDVRKALECLATADQNEDFAQVLVRDRLEQAAENGSVRACAKLAEMYEDHEYTMKALVRQGKTEEYFQRHACKWLERAAEQGDIDSTEKLANNYVEGTGVPIDFKLAEQWFIRAGKSKDYSRKKIQRKLQKLKPKYKKLFNFFDHDEDGEIDIHQFRAFYEECMMATGMSQKQSHRRTVSLYQGKTKYEILFNDMDADKNRSVDFEEIWSHPHTHTSIFPKTGAHVMAALKYFEKWDEHKATIAQRLEDEATTHPSGSKTPRLRRSASEDSIKSASSSRSRTPTVTKRKTSKSSVTPGEQKWTPGGPKRTSKRKIGAKKHKRKGSKGKRVSRSASQSSVGSVGAEYEAEDSVVNPGDVIPVLIPGVGSGDEEDEEYEDRDDDGEDLLIV